MNNQVIQYKSNDELVFNLLEEARDQYEDYINISRINDVSQINLEENNEDLGTVSYPINNIF